MNRLGRGAGVEAEWHVSRNCKNTFSISFPRGGRPSKLPDGWNEKILAYASVMSPSIALFTRKSPVPRTIHGGAICRAARVNAVGTDIRINPFNTSKTAFLLRKDRAISKNAARKVIGK